MSPRAGPSAFAGLFLVTLATLTYQLLLTRIFSVTMYYHFAFVAISVTMFGMAVGALIVYLRHESFAAPLVERRLAQAALAFAVTIVASFLAHLWLPFRPELSIAGVASVVLTYAILSVPFTCSGIVVALALTRFPGQVSALYAVDLAGAAVGCALLAPLLRLTDAPTAIVATAAAAALGAALFRRSDLPALRPAQGRPDRSRGTADLSAGALAKVEAGSHAGRGVAGVGSPSRGFRLQPEGIVAALLMLFAAVHTIAVRRDAAWLRLVWVKGQYEAPPIVERWNPFSRIRVIGDPARTIKPSGWGFSTTLPADLTARELHLDIDSYAGTELTAFAGDPSTVGHLKYDVTNVVHYLRPSSDVVVVGTGGGRDILSALAFNQRRVTGVEINPSILELVNGRFGDFTGHLDRDPRVRFVNDEARSYLARMTERVDIIQISLIDTWAATASGAFVLTESSLYTLEAWTRFLDRLSPRGVLSVSRWYYADRPGEIYRSAVLAMAALQRIGVPQPRAHVAIVRARPAATAGAPDGIGTILVSRDPLTAGDLDTLQSVAARLKFDIVQSPRTSLDDTFAAIADAGRLPALLDAYPLDISAPTDDSPFFFHMLRLRDVFDVRRWHDQGIVSFNMKAVGVLGVLLAAVLLMTAACIGVPLLLARGASLDGAGRHLLYFAAIGLGFMLVEISQLQRLTIFLGHPAYSLSVVLFALLVSSGLGSLATGRVTDPLASIRWRLGLTIAILLAFGFLTPVVAHQFESSSTPVRITLAIVVLCPIGFCMGMAFPLGMRLALGRAPQLAPWFWGVNGAASVCASVLAVVIAIGAGISAAFWTGTACYVVALAVVASDLFTEPRGPATLC
jgi:spermidine synthase